MKTTLPLTRKVQLGFGAVLAVLLLVGVVSYRSLDASAESERWVQHTQEVRKHLGTLLSALESIEASYSRLALRSDDALFQTSRTSISLLDQEQKTLRTLTADNPDQQRRLASLAGLAAQTVQLDDALVRSRRAGDPETAAEVIRAGHGQRILAEFRAIAHEMDDEESRLLLERNASALRRFRESKAAVILGTSLGLLVAAVAGWIVQRDIGARARANAAMLQSEERFRLLVEGVQDYAIFTLDANGRVASWNAGAERTKGYSADEIIGQNFSRFYAQEDIDQGQPEAELQVAAASGRSETESWRVRKDGSRFWANRVITAARDSSGRLLGFSEISRDITERKTAEERLVKKVAELKRSNDELEQFAYVASHDLQEPLRMVASYTQLLARRYHGRLDPDADEFIAYAVDGSNRMQGLIQDLLTYSRAGTSGAKLRKIPSENALHGALANLRATIEESGAVVTHDPLPAITTDDTQLTQVFQNLVGNAIKYRSAEVPRVHVSATSNADKEWIFSVRDNGLGIEPRYFDRIFILFQRLHGREEFKGTGIGLAICKKMLERLGGRIWVESQPRQGSTFYFALPEGAGK
jgi:PAS domain S-box-containing protein